LREVLVRIPEEIVEKLREIFPELKNESNAVIVRAALNRFLEGRK